MIYLMADFFSTRGVSFIIDELIKKSEKHIYLITPYLKFSNTLFERISVAISKNIKVSIVYGKTELNYTQSTLLNSLECNIYFKENLHAKCYLNESEAIICSMNLHSFSEVNNIEMGIKINNKNDREAYNDCLSEVLELVQNSVVIKAVSEKVKLKIIPKYNYDQFCIKWSDSISKNFNDITLLKVDNNISINNFPVTFTNFNNKYGFATIEINLHNEYLRQIRDEYLDLLYSQLEDYRCYWSSPYNRIFLYHAKDIEFENIDSDIEYCLEGLNILVDFVKSKII